MSIRDYEKEIEQEREQTRLDMELKSLKIDLLKKVIELIEEL